uniref:BKRF1 encodes EBNA-1 protein-like n=1 Tax=Oryza sativa subsp. japonica TaxID=39947 RepID=Q2QRP0_ORYSJ|nr:hypothetical protein LOC_Os12g26910 [Oryza sativa Japonica Group]
MEAALPDDEPARMNGEDDDGHRRWGSDGGDVMPRTMSPAHRCDAGGGGGAADSAREEEGPTGEIPARRMERPARHGGVPAKYGRRRGLDGEEDGVPVPGEVVATSAGTQETRQRRPEAEQWRQRHCCQRGCTSGGLRGKWRAGWGRGGDCDAERGDGTAGRCADAAAGAAGFCQRRRRERRSATVWLGSSGRGKTEGEGD